MPEIWTRQQFRQHSNAGRFVRRNNPELKTIDWALDKYHDVEPLAFSERRAFCLVIVEASKQYLQGIGPRGSSRRPGIVAIQAMALTKAGELTRAKKRRAKGNWKRAVAATKPLRVKEGSKAKPMHPDYWKEMRAPHYAGFVLKPIFEEWKKTSTYKNLDDWIESEWLPRAKVSSDPGLASKAISLEKNKVAYLTASADRKSREMQIKGGRVYTDSGVRFHTGDHTTAFSGSGWAIFVMSPNRSVFSASHKVGQFHHSSFLAGGPVLAAGEWAVDNGKVVAITAKSGHYKPDEKMFYEILRKLRHRGVRLTGVAACPKPWEKPQKYYDAKAVYLNKGQPSGNPVPLPGKVKSRANQGA